MNLKQFIPLILSDICRSVILWLKSWVEKSPNNSSTEPEPWLEVTSFLGRKTGVLSVLSTGKVSVVGSVVCRSHLLSSILVSCIGWWHRLLLHQISALLLQRFGILPVTSRMKVTKQPRHKGLQGIAAAGLICLNHLLLNKLTVRCQNGFVVERELQRKAIGCRTRSTTFLLKQQEEARLPFRTLQTSGECSRGTTKTRETLLCCSFSTCSTICSASRRMSSFTDCEADWKCMEMRVLCFSDKHLSGIHVMSSNCLSVSRWLNPHSWWSILVGYIRYIREYIYVYIYTYIYICIQSLLEHTKSVSICIWYHITT